MRPTSEKASVVLTILEDVDVDVVLINVSPSRISIATENQLRTLPFLLISLHATITNVCRQDYWREVRKEEKDGWRELQPLIIASRSKKGRRDQEAGTVNISPQALSSAKARSRSETSDERGYDDGTFHPSTNPYSGGPEQAAHRIGCMHGV
jgi:hypothetical protein